MSSVFWGSAKRHFLAPKTYNRAIGTMTQTDYVFVSQQLELILERLQQENVPDEYIVELKGLIWRVEQTRALKR